MEAVRPDEQSAAELFDDISLGIEFENRIDILDLVVRPQAVDAETAALRKGYGARFVATDKRPDALAVDVDIHGSRRPRRSFRPFAARYERPAPVREPSYGAVRIGQPALREGLRTCDKQHGGGESRDRSEAIGVRHGNPSYCENFEPSLPNLSSAAMRHLKVFSETGREMGGV